jgi:uncharacterized protein YbjT (DUF2867 family)
MEPSAPTARRSVVLIGGTGATGGHAARCLADDPTTARLTLLGRRAPAPLRGPVTVHVLDPLDPDAVAPHLAGHTDAVCALGIGQPSAVPRAEFLRVDRDGVLAFAGACRAAGIERFALLSAVDADASSSNWYLRAKGELEDGLRRLSFRSLRLVRPSVLLTPTARFGGLDTVAQALTPWISPLLAGPLRRYRGVDVARVGAALARPFDADGEQIWTWDELTR